MNFKDWFSAQDTQVDEREIDAAYDKAHIAVELVRTYRPHLLVNISTIANLATGAYGMYNSTENQKVLPPDIKRWLIYRGIDKNEVGNIPMMMYQKYGVDTRNIKSSNKIHVNVRRILSLARNDLEAVLQIASTIVHEAIHSQEREKSGLTDEIDPKAEEQRFMREMESKIPQILQKYPELRGQEFGF